VGIGDDQKGPDSGLQLGEKTEPVGGEAKTGRTAKGVKTREALKVRLGPTKGGLIEGMYLFKKKKFSEGVGGTKKLGEGCEKEPFEHARYQSKLGNRTRQNPK